MFFQVSSKSGMVFLSTKINYRQNEEWNQRHRGYRHSLTRRVSSSSLDITPNEIQMRQDCKKIIHAAIRAVDPFIAVRNRIRLHTNETADGSSSPKKSVALVVRPERDGSRELKYNLSNYDNIKIFAFGKASAAMAMAAAEVAKEAASISSIKLEGTVIIKDDHATPEEIESLAKCNIAVRAASHPVPDARSVSGANEILQSAQCADARTLIVVCISGGGSALFCSPRHPLTLEDLMKTNAALLSSGMPIEKMNVIRKRLENGKGGKLAASAYPATVLTLVLSDIIGDPLDLIASGPTVPDSSGWVEAWEIAREYGLDEGGEHELPPTVLKLLQMGMDGLLGDTPKSDNPAFSYNDATSTLHAENVLVGNNCAAVMAAAEEAKQLGYHPVVLGTRVDGEASCVAGVYVSMAEMLSRQRDNDKNNLKYEIAQLPAALIAGGETTVTLPHNSKGKGGRNQELALSAAIKMEQIGLREVVLASVGTDGTDGPTDAAGAMVDGGTTIRIEDSISCDTTNNVPTPTLRAKDALRNHDAYNYFNSGKDDSLIITGATGTNVADICITLVH
ncbi:hypothetical protein HJC23_008397 [Cyclotella cryptica]|uniref:Glycerate kinase n=1 Tax=Cyclotella cryptica TaxID=29204 RepID=A0ABD3PWJ9_9STRA